MYNTRAVCIRYVFKFRVFIQQHIKDGLILIPGTGMDRDTSGLVYYNDIIILEQFIQLPEGLIYFFFKSRGREKSTWIPAKYFM